VPSHVQSRELVHMPGTPCRARASSAGGCALVCYAVLCTVVQWLYFKPRTCRNKCKSGGDVAGATVLLKVLYYKDFKCSTFMFIFYVCIIFAKSVINLLQPSTIQLIVLAGYLG
jgi:hypothetical protein